LNDKNEEFINFITVNHNKILPINYSTSWNYLGALYTCYSTRRKWCTLSTTENQLYHFHHFYLTPSRHVLIPSRPTSPLRKSERERAFVLLTLLITCKYKQVVERKGRGSLSFFRSLYYSLVISNRKPKICFLGRLACSYIRKKGTLHNDIF